MRQIWPIHRRGTQFHLCLVGPASAIIEDLTNLNVAFEAFALADVPMKHHVHTQEHSIEGERAVSLLICVTRRP